MTKLIEDAGGFAEVFPEHKFEVVEVLQKGHHIVGMTGADNGGVSKSITVPVQVTVSTTRLP